MVRLSLIFFALILFPSLVSGISLVNEDLILEETVYFEVCDGELINISCVDEYFSMQRDNCTIHGFDYDSVSCEDIVIKTNKTQKELIFEDYEEALISSLKIISEIDPVDIALKIYGYSLINKTDKMKDLLEILKESRDNFQKCWPERCDIKETVDVLYYLSKAGLDKENRVYYDALLWVEHYQNRVENEDWRLRIRPHRAIRDDDVVVCEVFFGGESETFELTKNESVINHVFTYESNSFLNVSCDARFHVEIRNYFYELVRKLEDYADKTVRFYMEGGCWSDNTLNNEIVDGDLQFGRSTHCVPGLTEKILLLIDLSSESYDEGLEWLESQIDRARFAGKQLKSNKEILDNINAYRVTKDPDVRRWILFTQNNDGSFGEDRDKYVTMNAIAAFTEPEDYEWRRDAIDWIKSEKTPRGWAEPRENIIGYALFGLEVSPIRISPSFLFFENEINFEIETREEHELELSNNIVNKINLSYDVEENKGSLKRLVSDDGVIIGHLILKTDNREKLVPLKSEIVPSISFEFEEEYYMLSDEDIIIVPVKKSSSAFDCELEFSDFFENISQKNVQERIFVPHVYKETFNDEITIKTTCVTNNLTIKHNYTTWVRKNDYAPFQIRDIRLSRNNEPGHIIIRNNLQENYTLSLAWETDTFTYSVPRTLDLKNKDLKVYIYQKAEHPTNETINDTLIIKALGHREDISLEIKLKETPLEFTETHKYIEPRTYYWVWFLLILVPIVIISLIFRKYNKQKKEIKKEPKKAKKVKAPTKKKKPKKKKSLANILIALDKTLNETDQEIVSELEKDGFKKEEIEKALSDFEKFKKPKEEK